MIRVKDVSFSYSNGSVLRSISFEVKKKEFFCIAGSNGAGKTTLIRLLSRVFKPTSGVIELNGKNIWYIPQKEFAKRVSVVSQNPSFDFVRVREFVVLGRIPHFGRFQIFESKEDKGKVERALELCGLKNLENNYMTQISGGERQLVFIARALATEPEVLLLDEPLSNLDICHQEKILKLLVRLREEIGLTIVAVLHDLNVASEFADCLMLLGRGVIIKSGKPEDVIRVEYVSEAYSLKNPTIYKNPISSKPFLCICKTNHRS